MGLLINYMGVLLLGEVQRNRRDARQVGAIRSNASCPGRYLVSAVSRRAGSKIFLNYTARANYQLYDYK